jgi:hypothetical protein
VCRVSGVPTHGLERHSEYLDPLLGGRTEPLGGWPDSLTALR